MSFPDSWWNVSRLRPGPPERDRGEPGGSDVFEQAMGGWCLQHRRTLLGEGLAVRVLVRGEAIAVVPVHPADLGMVFGGIVEAAQNDLIDEPARPAHQLQPFLLVRLELLGLAAPHAKRDQVDDHLSSPNGSRGSP